MLVLFPLLVLSPVHAADIPAPAVPSLPAIVVHLPEAIDGPPDRDCKVALVEAEAAKKGQPPPEMVEETAPPRSTKLQPKPDYDAMDTIVVDKARTVVADLPGGRPEALPPQLLEGSPEALALVAGVLRAAQNGQRVRISVFGASHTEGDWWTGALRRTLQDRYGDLGHGFVWPAAIARGYRGNDVNLCRTDDWKVDYVGLRGARADGLFGPAGASVSSADPHDFGWVETTRTNPHGRAVSRFELFTLQQPGGGTVLATVDATEPVPIPTHGDELALRRHALVVPDGPHRLTLQPAGDGEVRVFGVSVEREGTGVIVDAIGIRGQTARSWLEWEPEIAAQGLAALDPDMVVLAYGTNEANDLGYDAESYRADLREVLGRLRRAAPDAACVLVGPSDRGKKVGKDTYAVWDRTTAVAQVQREVAPEFGCAFWDWQQATGGPGSMIAWKLHDPQLAAGDLIHFTRDGYELSAERFLAALDATLQ